MTDLTDYLPKLFVHVPRSNFFAIKVFPNSLYAREKSQVPSFISSSPHQILQKRTYNRCVHLQLQTTTKNPYFVLGKLYFSLNERANTTVSPGVSESKTTLHGGEPANSRREAWPRQKTLTAPEHVPLLTRPWESVEKTGNRSTWGHIRKPEKAIASALGNSVSMVILRRINS